MKLFDVKRILLETPRKEILRRLKYHEHKTDISPEHMAVVETHIQRAVALCEPKGRYVVLPVNLSDNVVMVEGIKDIKSASLVKLLQNSVEMVLMGVTVGPMIGEQAHKFVEQGDMTAAVVYDAVGSEMADAAIAFVQNHIQRTIRPQGKRVTRRFSPGYGDVDLTVQKQIFNVLQLTDFGVQLSERYMLIPEKSVIAIAGVEEIRA